MRRMFLATSCAALLGLTASAGEAPKGCCARSQSATAPASASKMRCSLTGKVVEKCCCVQKEGKTYCTLAKETVENCCCSPLKDDAQRKQANR
jgi:hypothetical protein